MWGRSGAEWGPTFSFLTPPRRRGAPGGKVHSSAVYHSVPGDVLSAGVKLKGQTYGVTFSSLIHKIALLSPSTSP